MTAFEHTLLEYLFQKRVKCVCVYVCVCVCVCVEVMYDESAVYNYFNTSIIRTPSVGDAKNVWSCTSSLPYIFMATCLIVHSQNFAH